MTLFSRPDWARAHRLSAIMAHNLDREDSATWWAGTDPPHLVWSNRLLRELLSALEYKSGRRTIARVVVVVRALQPFDAGAAGRARRRRKNITIRCATWTIDGEIDRIRLENAPHMANFVHPRESVESLVMPLKDLADPFISSRWLPDAGLVPGHSNFNGILIHLNRLRPGIYVRALVPEKGPSASRSGVVVPEYWDTGVAILLFDEMARRAAARLHVGRSIHDRRRQPGHF
jgi:hypothetical protein